MSVRIRRLRPSDYAGFVELLKVSGMEPRTQGRESRKSFSVQLGNPRNRYLGAFDGRRLVGVVLGTHDGRKGWINRLAVHPDRRRIHIASRLVRMCERGLREQGIQMFAALIEADNAASKAVFQSLGYEISPMLCARKLHPGV